jgi:hypothetical protein
VIGYRPRSATEPEAGLVSLSLVCAVEAVGSYREASRLLAPIKQHAKGVPGSSWVLGRPRSDRVEVLRGRVHADRAMGTPA